MTIVYSQTEIIKMTEDKCLLPKKLTAEIGAKALLSGEFYETIELPNPIYCGCGECSYCYDNDVVDEYITQKIPVSWDTIKDIYNMIVEHYNEENS